MRLAVHPAFEDGTDTGFRNVGQLQIDAGEIPSRKYMMVMLVSSYSLFTRERYRPEFFLCDLSVGMATYLEVLPLE